MEVEYLNKEQVLYALKNKTSVDKITSHANFNNNQNSYYNKSKTSQQYKTNNNHEESIEKSELDLSDITVNSKYSTENKNQLIDDADSTNNVKEINSENEKSKNKYQVLLDELSGTNTGQLLDNKFNLIKKVDVENIYDEIKATKKDINSVVFDGIITQRLVDLSKEKNIENLVAVRMNEIVKKPETIKIITK